MIRCWYPGKRIIERNAADSASKIINGANPAIQGVLREALE